MRRLPCDTRSMLHVLNLVSVLNLWWWCVCVLFVRVLFACVLCVCACLCSSARIVCVAYAGGHIGLALTAVLGRGKAILDEFDQVLCIKTEGQWSEGGDDACMSLVTE